MNTLKLERLSIMPNQFGSFAYAVKEDISAEDQAKLDARAILDTENGPVIYSRTKLGLVGKEIVVPVRIIEQRKDGKGTGRFFVNLIDKSVEGVADDMYKKHQSFQMATRYFGQSVEASVELGNGVSIKIGGKPVQAAQPVQAAAAPVKEAVDDDPQ